MRSDRINLGTKAVSLGILHKDLLPLKDCMCAGGCGRRAEQYHHYIGYEDWQLLDVIPVCRHCHSLADRIRNHDDIDRELPEVQNLFSAIEREKNIHHRRRLYLLKEFKNTEMRCRYLISIEGKKPVVIFSNLNISTFSEQMHNKQLDFIPLYIECVLCGCNPSMKFDTCSCPCHRDS
jgi:hypothetical protein